MKALVLRTCTAEMRGTSEHSKHFVWPKSGMAEAPDWNPDPSVQCGQGLHGLLWGHGDWSMLSSADDAVWMVVVVDPADGIVVGTEKCRFKRGEVVYCGDRSGAMMRVLCGPEAMANAQSEAEKWQEKSGDGSKAASSGDGSKAASSGDGSTAASSGDYSKAASSGNYSTAASSGDYSKAASSGYGSKAASSGNYSKAASSGDGSTAASSGYGSTAASSGVAGIASAIGSSARAKAGENGLIIVTFWDDGAKRYRARVGEVGINGVKQDTWYTARNGVLCEEAPTT